MKRVTALWWAIMVAFAIGEAIILVTLAVCQTMYVSDPLMICLLVGGITFGIALISSGVTVKESTVTSYDLVKYVNTDETKDTTADVIKPILKKEKRPPLDTDPEDIDKVDELLRKENTRALQGKASKGKHEAPSKA